MDDQAMPMGEETKKCSCGMAMDAEGHADMMAADPAAHHEASADAMPADETPAA